MAKSMALRNLMKYNPTKSGKASGKSTIGSKQVNKKEAREAKNVGYDDIEDNGIHDSHALNSTKSGKQMKGK